MATRTVWRTPAAGAISRLTLREESLGQLEPGKIRIEVKAIGLNFADLFALTGLYSATPTGSFIPGLEFSGIVTEPGGDFAIGHRVMGVTRFGGYASIIDVAPAYCMPLPDHWSFAQGAAYPAQTITAWYALKALGDVRPHYNVLIQSAAGGVGLQAMQICKKLGVHAIGTVGRPEKLEFLNQLGFKDVLVRSSAFKTMVQEILASRELHLALDAVGGKTQLECYELLAPTGRLIVFGAAEFTPGTNRPRYLSAALRYLRRPRYDPLKLTSENRSVMGFNLIWLWDRTDIMQPILRELDALKLDPPYVGREFPFTEAHAAIEFLRSGASIGKVILNIGTRI